MLDMACVRSGAIDLFGLRIYAWHGSLFSKRVHTFMIWVKKLQQEVVRIRDSSFQGEFFLLLICPQFQGVFWFPPLPYSVWLWVSYPSQIYCNWRLSLTRRNLFCFLRWRAQVWGAGPSLLSIGRVWRFPWFESRCSDVDGQGSTFESHIRAGNLASDLHILRLQLNLSFLSRDYGAAHWLPSFLTTYVCRATHHREP